MAFSSKPSFTSSSVPGAQIQTKEVVKPNHIQFKSMPATQKWSSANNLTLAASPRTNFRQPARAYPNDCSTGIEPEQLKASVRMLINQNANDPLEGLAMIDAMQRLGIDYLFEEEIEGILDRHYTGFSTQVHVDGLRGVALRFRLLRQEGYYVPAGVFNNFKNKNGEFEKNLSCNIQGLMSLYEASQLAIRGEGVLDEVADYSYKLLNSMATHIDHQQARIVKNTLEHPQHKSLARLMAKNFFYDLQGRNGWINVLRDLAELDFKIAQYQHQQELLRISTWWKDLGLSKELQFARDQPMKWYMWSMACLADPKLSNQRIELTKAISFIYIIDDIFDVSGTLDELTLFAEVVNRWDTAAMGRLPYSMKICFGALDKITNEISYNVFRDHGWNPVHSIRKMWASLCNAFLAEARWFASGDMPKAEEYLKNGIVSSGVHIVLGHIFFLLGERITRENVELIENDPGIISSTATILRLWDDLGSAKDEEQDGHDGSYVECYLKEHRGSSVEDARKHVMNIISEEWKHLNEECLSPNPFSPTFTNASLNIARMVPLMYNYDDKHRLPSLEEHMKSLLFESVEVFSL